MIPHLLPGARVSVGDTVFEVLRVEKPGVLRVRSRADVNNVYRISAPRPTRQWMLIERIGA